MALQDAQRLQNAHLLLNRVVFDCIDESLSSKVPDREEANLEVGDGEFNRLTRDVLDDVSWKQPSPHNSSFISQLKPYYTLINKNDTTLLFESRFESGNLRRAVQIYENEYDLILKFDVNTRGHTQWYYFSVSNMRRGVKYKFNIINLIKPDSLYNNGMKPLLYSESAARHSGRGWIRAGTDICYYQNNIKRKNGYFYTFTWSHIFECMTLNITHSTLKSLQLQFLQSLTFSIASTNR